MGPAPAVAEVRLAVRRALVDLPRESLVLVGVSGGADSLALAAATAHEAPRVGLRAGAVTVDHRLQPGSTVRAEQVAGLLQQMGLRPVEVVPVTVTGSGGPEAAARRARHRAFAECRERLGAAAVLLGHTRDDQAESVLLGLARGSGARSLSAMAPVAGPLLRPLLGVARIRTREACAALSLPVWDDPQNEDRSFVRVRVRRDVLPELERSLGPGVAGALARTASLLREDADALDQWAALVRSAATGADGSLDVEALGAVPVAVRHRALRAAALDAGCPAGDLTADHVAQLGRLVVGWRGQGPLHLPGPVEGSRRCGRLLLASPAAPRPGAPSDPDPE